MFSQNWGCAPQQVDQQRSGRGIAGPHSMHLPVKKRKGHILLCSPHANLSVIHVGIARLDKDVQFTQYNSFTPITVILSGRVLGHTWTVRSTIYTANASISGRRPGF